MISTKLIFFPDIKDYVRAYPYLISNSVLTKLNIPPQHRAYLAKMQPIWDAEKAAVAAKANRENMVNLDIIMVNNISWILGLWKFVFGC